MVAATAAVVVVDAGAVVDEAEVAEIEATGAIEEIAETAGKGCTGVGVRA